MKRSEVIILGQGLLGTELKKQTGWDHISRPFDITKGTKEEWFRTLHKAHHGSIFYFPYKVMVNAIAFTQTYSNDRETCWDVNVAGVKKAIEFCNKYELKLVQISTDYLYSNSITGASEEDVPVHCGTWYGYTKLVADALVQLECKDYLIIRATHKPKPFPYEKAIHQVGNFDYVDKIASLIIQLIEKDASGIFNVGTEMKTMYTLAKQTRDVKFTDEKLHKQQPTDLTMNITKLTNFLG